MIKKLKKEQLFIGVLLGILLLVIAIPVPKEKTEEYLKENELENLIPETKDSTEERLKEILQQISGVGQVEVFITYEDKGKLIVEKDETASEELVQEADSSGGSRTTTTNRKEWKTIYGTEESPYVVQELVPTVKGILVVAQGGGDEKVKLKIQQTLEALFGLDSHKISIMKMEVIG